MDWYGFSMVLIWCWDRFCVVSVSMEASPGIIEGSHPRSVLIWLKHICLWFEDDCGRDLGGEKGNGEGLIQCVSPLFDPAVQTYGVTAYGSPLRPCP